MIEIKRLAEPLTKNNSVIDPRSAYIHIPFCRRRCYYCDFPISVLGSSSSSHSPWVTQYVEILCQEIEATLPPGLPLTTVFFGGGTPSLLSVGQLQQILATLEQRFGIASGAEISMEMDPGTFDREKLNGYQQAGINRVSLGVQAFQNELLQVCGRSHSDNDIMTAIELLERANIPNFSLDLISGLPHQTVAQWEDSLDRAIAVAPQHISCYDMVLEPVTAFGRQYQPGETPLPTDETTAQMYRIARQKLTEAGYKHYEISNYAQPGYQCRHNRVYWRNQSYYGFGMGAASYINKCRFTRPRTRREYFEWVQQWQAGEVKMTPQSATDELLETLMLGLRLADGIDLTEIAQQFGQQTVAKIWMCLLPYQAQGWVEALGSGIRLSDPEGFLFSNTVLAKLFEQLEAAA